MKIYERHYNKYSVSYEEHGDDAEHQHTWEERWWPWNRQWSWRSCVIPGCNAYIKRKVNEKW